MGKSNAYRNVLTEKMSHLIGLWRTLVNTNKLMLKKLKNQVPHSNYDYRNNNFIY